MQGLENLTECLAQWWYYTVPRSTHNYSEFNCTEQLIEQPNIVT